MLPLDLSGSGPLNQQIFTALRGAILSRRYLPGSALLPSRKLADELAVSRNTVLWAYEQLAAEGYVVARNGAGTFIADGVGGLIGQLDGQFGRQLDGAAQSNEVAAQCSAQLSDFSLRIRDKLARGTVRRSPRQSLRYDFLYGEPGYEDLPIESWARIVGKIARQMTRRQLGYAPHAGLPQLREQIAGYLGRARGVRCRASQVIITQGTQEAIDLLVRVLVNPGDPVVVEEPQYRGFVRCLQAAGARICYVPVDAQGLQTDELGVIDDARLACITPSHQFPAGGILSLNRRLSLLAWAARHNTMILEDDYDGEFRYRQRPMASLQSLDQHGSVVYVGTASKIFFPALKVGWMVVPDHLVELIGDVKSMADASPSTLEQLALAEFIKQGHLERHIYRMRKGHGRRRATLLATIAECLGNRVSVQGSDAGIHVLLRLHTLRAGQMDKLLELCRAQDVGVYSSAGYYQTRPLAAELILGYGALSHAEIRLGIGRLAAVIAQLEAEAGVESAGGVNG